MVSSCSISLNVLLTKRLIEVCDFSANDIHRFSNRSEWIEGLDQWLDEEKLSPSPSSPSVHFDEDLRLYLPVENSKDARLKVSPKLNSIYHECLSARLQELAEKVKDLYLSGDDRDDCPSPAPLDQSSIQSDSFNSSSFEQSEERNPTKKVKRSVRRRHPLRSIASDYCSCSNENVRRRNEEDNLDKIIKEHLTSLFTRGSISKRTSIQIPLINIKHDNHFNRSMPPIDSTVILQRYEKLQQLLIHPSKRTLRTDKQEQDREEIPAFGLTITPLGLTSNHELQKSNSSIQLNEQSVSFDEDPSRRLMSKENLQDAFISSSGDLILSTDLATSPSRRIFRSHRFSSRTQPDSRKASQYLPPILTGKRLQISFTQQRH